MAEAVYCVNVIKKREEPLFSMLDAPASPRMGPYFKFGREQPNQSSTNPVRMMHRCDGGGDLLNDTLKYLKSLPLADFYKLYLVDSMHLVHETTHLILFLISNE